MSNKLKKDAEYWINCNVWDGEDRSGSNDYATFSPDDLLELFNDFIDDVTEGYKLVPIEPTKQMLLAGNAVLPSIVNCDNTYKAMLEAADEEN